MDLKHGKRHPWLLSASQSFQLFAALFACELALLIAMVHEAGRNRNVLESIAKSAEAARIREAEKTVESAFQEKSSARSVLRISMPESWKWRGCRASDSGDSVEILLGSSSPPISRQTAE